MDEIIKIDDEYKNWIHNISDRYRSCQIKAAVRVNEEMLKFYWSLGRDMEKAKSSYDWGSHFYSQISKDLKKLLPDAKSFSPRNLLYMNQFYRLFSDEIIAKQVVAQLEENEITKQSVSRYEQIFRIPWGHMIQIINKYSDNQQKALFYIEKTIENNWSRAVLMNFLGTDLYERQGKAITNFEMLLPANGSDLAKAITKDPYNFDFLTLRENYDEKELKDALMSNIQDFLLELGKGFAFVGREYRLLVGETEQFLDMLFYNIQEHCYVVVEVKTRDFEPADMGQLGTYISAVDGILRGNMERPTVGLLICKTKDNVLAQYAVNVVNVPIGISEYELTRIVPEDYKGSMPTIEQIEEEFGKIFEGEN
ncbi:MAG: PDDEXK nuclease domain-containing protein [Clostridiales bacterium]|nr:PDDEXK nuclease domain-containing protein [Clostridiales bacterium]